MPMIKQLLLAIFQPVLDRINVILLRREIMRYKASQYDLLMDNVRGLRRAIETQKRAQDDLHKQIDQRDRQIEKLREEYVALEARRESEGKMSVCSERLALFKQLQSIATQLPTLRAAVENGADLKAGDVLDVVAPLDQVLVDLGFDRIGAAGTTLSYDPQRHKLVGRGARSTAPDDTVRVRYVGYMYGDEVICKAEVTRVEQN
jgi:molecular chaperone GrpE (heat shock protein)